MNTLDLDALAPEPKKVKLNGKIFDVYPARLKDFIAIQKLFLSFKDKSPEDQAQSIGHITEVLKPICPDIEEMNLTMQQLTALLEFAYAQEASNQVDPTEKKNGNLADAIAYFINHYPAYKIDDVLQEYTSRFFIMVKSASKIDAIKQLQLIEAISVPHLKKGEAQRIIKAYKRVLKERVQVDQKTVEEERARFKKKLKGELL